MQRSFRSSSARRWRPLLLCLGVLMGMSCVAHAESDLVLRLKSQNAFSGSLDSTIELAATTGPGRNEDVVVDELEPTFGTALQLELAVNPYFSAGWLVALSSWRSKSAGQLQHSYSTWLDVDLVLRARYPLLDDELAVYFLFPFGLTINRFSSETNDSNGADFGHGVGFNLSTLVGMEFELVDGFSLFAEGGWIYRELVHDTFAETFGSLAEVEYSAWCHQWALNLGVAFEL